MGIYLADQTIRFIQACLIGALLGVVYDVFRITRIAFPTPKAVVFAQDVLFFSACGVITFFFLLGAVDGQVRVFLLVGELVGAVLYFFTLGQLVMGVSKTIIQIIKGILLFFYKWMVHPIWRLVYNLVFLILRPFFFFGKILRKKGQKVKFSLKVRRRMLYNHYIGLFRNIGRKKAGGEKRNGAQTEEP